MDNIIVGKRITFGGIIGALVSVGCWFWHVNNPETPIPAEVAVGLTTALTGLGQIIIANKLPITKKGDEGER